MRLIYPTKKRWRSLRPLDHATDGYAHKMFKRSNAHTQTHAHAHTHTHTHTHTNVIHVSRHITYTRTRAATY